MEIYPKDEQHDPVIGSYDNGENLPSSSGDHQDRNLTNDVNEENLDCKRKRRKLPEKGTTEYVLLRKLDAKARRQNRSSAHKCPYCDFKAVFPSKIRAHIVARHTDGRFQCEICQSTFNTQQEKRKHIKDMHKLIHSCDVCGFEAPRPSVLRKHIDKVHVNGMKCTVSGCNMTLLKRQLKRHLLDCHFIGTPESLPSLKKTKCIQRCGQCNFASKSIEALEQHIENAHKLGIECPFVDCHQKFLVSNIEAHFKKFHSDKDDMQIVAKIEKKSDGSVSAPVDNTSDDELLDNASQIAENDVLEPIEDISSEREPDSYLSEDLGIVPKQEEPIDTGFSCGQCKSQFTDLYNLKKHVKIVHAKVYKKDPPKVKKHSCTFEGCTKSFTTAGLLEDHLNVHRGVKPFHCEHCNQFFHARARFAVHLSKYHQMSIRSYDALFRNLPIS